MTKDAMKQAWVLVRVDDLMAVEWDRQANLLPPSKSELTQSYRERAQQLRQTLNKKTIPVKVQPN